MTRHQRLARTALIALSIALPGTHLAAGPVNSVEVYLDKSTFLSSTGATEASTPFPVADEGPLASRTVGDVTYVAPRFWLRDWTSHLPGHEFVVSIGAGGAGGAGNDGLDLLFAAPVFAAGFDFFEPTRSTTFDGCNLARCEDSTFEVTLRSGVDAIDSFTFNAPDDVLAFVGVRSLVAFDRLDVREIVGTSDNEFYGRVYTSRLPAVQPGTAQTFTEVPAPAGFALVALGMLAGTLRRRKS